MIKNLFDVTFHAGPARATSSEIALSDLSMAKTKILYDDGGVMDISVETKDSALNGFFSILTDNKISINKISLSDEVTDEDTGEISINYINLKLPSFDSPEKIYRGGKVFYLYQATGGKAINIGANKTSKFRIKYGTNQISLEHINPNVVTSLMGIVDSPFYLELNTHYIQTDVVYTITGDTPQSSFGELNKNYLKVPSNPNIGDSIHIHIVPADIEGHGLIPTLKLSFDTGVVVNSLTVEDAIFLRGYTASMVYLGGDVGWLIRSHAKSK